MFNMARINIILGMFAATIVFASQETVILSDGFYLDGEEQVEVKTKKDGERLVVIYGNGDEEFNFDQEQGKYLTRLGNQLIILDKNRFKIVDKSNIEIYGTYSFSSKPGFFKQLLSLLVTSALLFSFFQFYLKLNKVWKRRKILDVANSISIVASLLGFATLIPFLLNSLLITGDYASAAKYILGIVLATVFSLISVGYFVEENRGIGFFTLLGRALKSEGKESGDLLADMIRPKGARKIIDILKKLAAIDDDIAQEEIDLINQFSHRWKIDIPELKPGKPEEITNLVELKALVQSYLDEGPDTDVAEALVDLINMMAEADDEVTEEEAMAVAEFSGMIAHYVSSEKGGEIDMWEVNIVPQGDEQINAVKEILPDLDVVKDRGGSVFKIGRYFSEDYAEAVCAKYISLGLYSNCTRLRVDLSKED